MTWQLAIALYLVMSASFTLLQRSYAKDELENPMLSMAFMYVFTILPFGVIQAFASGGISFSHDSIIWLAMMAGGVLFAFGNSLSFKAVTKIDAAQASILGNFRTITTVAVSSIFLGEVLNAAQYTGAALILIAILIVASAKASHNLFKVDKYSAIALLSAVLFGLGLSNEKFILDSMELPSYLAIGWGFQTLAMVLFSNTNKTQVKKLFSNKSSLQLIVLGLLRALSGVFIAIAFQESDNSSLVTSIASYKIVLVLVGSYVFLKERENIPKKIFSIALATAGLGLLF